MNPKLWVVALGVVCIAWILFAAWLVDRAPKCSDCGWREGHRLDCATLDRLVDEAMRREAAIMARVHSGELTPFEAMKLVQRGYW